MLKEDCERIGVLECGAEFQKIGFMFREQPIGDYGIDAIIETRDDKYLSGKLIAVQIKSGDSYFKEQKANCVIYRGDIKHYYYYWLNHSLPVIIVLSSPTTGELIWECVNKQTAKRCQEGWKISIPRNSNLGEKRLMKYIIGQRNNLYTEDDKIYYNGKMIEYEGNLEEAVTNKKVEIYRIFLSRHFDNTIVLTGASSSFGIGKTEIKGMTMKKLWEEIVNECGKESIEKLGKKINYKIDDITSVNFGRIFVSC